MTDDVKTAADSAFVTGASDEVSMGFDGANATLTTTTGNLTVTAATCIILSGGLCIGSPVSVTISGDAITHSSTNAYIGLIPEGGGGAGADDLSTINGGNVGDILIIEQDANPDAITIKDGVGNINLAGSADIALASVRSKAILLKSGANWDELARSIN